MKATDKIKELQGIIAARLLPEIKGKKIILLDVPYYSNIGDTLIWQGTHDLLKSNDIECVQTSSKDSFDFRQIPADWVILLQGGGNFGDIWAEHQLFREKVISSYPDNKIIILPQTIYFAKEENLKRDAEIFSRHNDLLIVARDEVSFWILNKYYGRNRALLLPDMALCINFKKFNTTGANDGRTLFFERQDKEANPLYVYNKIIPDNAERHEWPLMEHQDISWRTKWLYRIKYRLPRYYDAYWNLVMRKYYIGIGVDFINRYETVFTTRLHGAILSLLLGKKIVLFDNSYGKNSSFFKTWLTGVDEIELIEPTVSKPDTILNISHG